MRSNGALYTLVSDICSVLEGNVVVPALSQNQIDLLQSEHLLKSQPVPHHSLI